MSSMAGKLYFVFKVANKSIIYVMCKIALAICAMMHLWASEARLNVSQMPKEDKVKCTQQNTTTYTPFC